MFERRMFTRVALTLLFGLQAAAAEAAADGAILRIFLKDGTTLATYGEFTRLADRVVVSLPLELAEAAPRLHLVSIPADSVDWERTDRYADGARRLRYFAGRAEEDFQQVTTDAAATLNRLLREPNPSARLTIAREARQLLAEWPAAHFNYRSNDVAEIVHLLDETISDLRAATGARDFDLSFVATIEPSPAVNLLPDPTPAELIDQASKVARLGESHAERVSLWRAILALLAQASNLPAAWVQSRQFDATQALRSEVDTERDYDRLGKQLLSLASVKAAQADVRAVEGLIGRAERENVRLGRARPAEMNLMQASLREYLERARLLRLSRDQWAMRREEYRAYARSVNPLFRELKRGRRVLDDIRLLAGPDRSSLETFFHRLELRRRAFTLVTPPQDLESTHAVLASAVQLALTSATGRRTALESGDLRTAWNASAAAAGALMLASQAQSELQQRLQPPQLR